MPILEMVSLIAGSAVAGTVYITPSLIGVARANSQIRRIAVLNTCLGWTVIGWFYALQLASRPAAGSTVRGVEWSTWRAGRPEAAGPPSAAATTYLDGSNLVSASGRAKTWAICTCGRWGIAFELDGVQRIATWVDTSDVPIDVLASALACDPERKR